MDPKDHRTDNNKKKSVQLHDLVNETFSRVLRKGYFGHVTFNAVIEDGAIQEIEKKESEKHR